MKPQILSMVFPLYNEEDNVEKVITPIIQLFNNRGVSYELILVDNGSRDNTSKIIDELANLHGNIKKVVVKVNQGYGWGIINGLYAASGDYIGYMGGDGQIDVNDLFRVYEKITTENLDLAKVCREKRGDGSVRVLITIIFNTLFYLMFHVKTIDINGSPKIFKKEWLNWLAPVSKDWFLDAEIMIKAKSLQMTVGEVPVSFLPREGGKSSVRLGTLWEFLNNMFSYKFSGNLKQWSNSKSSTFSKEPDNNQNSSLNL